MRTYFEDRAQALFAGLGGDEVLLLNLMAETSDFARFNHARVRQAGHVRDMRLGLTLSDRKRRVSTSETLSGDSEQDDRRLESSLATLREQLRMLPEDPFLVICEDESHSERSRPASLPEPAQVVDQVRALGGERDLVGIYAGGDVAAGFASSLGRRAWFDARTFHLEWSLFRDGDRAVKSAYAGFEWKDADFAARMEASGRKYEALGQPARELSPGAYRAYLAPAAVGELTSLLAWGGFSYREQQAGLSPLLKLVKGDCELSEKVVLSENIESGCAPDFQEDGFARPDKVALVDHGKHAGALVSPRSSKQYGVPANGASAAERPCALDLAGGNIAPGHELEMLGSGLYIGNLWYLNYADRNTCGATGLTRFATFWVENGEWVAPVDTMRFQDSVYRMLGDGLVDFTAEREWEMDPSTYGARSTNSQRLPGALVEDFQLTL